MDVLELRSAVEQVDREIAALAGPHPVLQVAWSRLVRSLALGPRQATRGCPYCGETGMRDATVCGYCWRKLVPPLELETIGVSAAAAAS